MKFARGGPPAGLLVRLDRDDPFTMPCENCGGGEPFRTRTDNRDVAL
jgi:hypothetical protein